MSEPIPIELVEIQDRPQGVVGRPMKCRKEDHYKLRICVWIAEGWNNHAILLELKKEFGLKLSESAIEKYRYSKKWKQCWVSIRRQMEERLIETAISQKACRLKYLQEIHDDAIKKGKPRIALEAISQARAETVERNYYNGYVENEKQVVNNIKQLDITVLTGAELAKQLSNNLMLQNEGTRRRK